MKTIVLTKGFSTVIDDEDFEKVSLYPWQAIEKSGKFYAARCPHVKKSFKHYSSRYVALHRFIMDAQNGQEVDHINGDTLDNRKSNLRFCTHQQNMCNMKRRKDNSSGFKGVIERRDRPNASRRWMARIKVNGITHFLGSFATASEASIVYDKAAVRLHGEFAKTNDDSK